MKVDMLKPLEIRYHRGVLGRGETERKGWEAFWVIDSDKWVALGFLWQSKKDKKWYGYIDSNVEPCCSAKTRRGVALACWGWHKPRFERLGYLPDDREKVS